jgi:long-chain acyl-CoA synthetase
MTMLLHELLSRSAQHAPRSIAVIEPRTSITYEALQQEALAIADRLREAGIEPGDRVVLACDNSIAFIACYFGVLNAGAVVVPVPPGPRSDRFTTALHDCSPAACIVDQATWPLVGDADAGSLRARFVVRQGSEAGHATTVLEQRGGGGHPPSPSASAAAPPGLAAIIYTSGTTGAARGVMLSHANVTSNAAAIVEYLGLTAADRMMVILPFYYVYGLSLLHTHVAVGGSLVLDNRFAYPKVVLNAMQEHGVTGFAGVPSTFALLLHKFDIRSLSFPALRYVTQAGGPMPPALAEEWLRALPDVPFYIMYGATEAAARLAYLPPTELPRRLGSIGRAIAGVEIRVLRDDGRVASAGEVGELVARGPNISSGYWNCAEETRDRFGPEGFRTGDLGFADADGFLYLVGRRHDMIKVGAHRVSAKEIEEVLYQHPAVHEAAIIGIPHPLLGEAPAAHVVLRDRVRATAGDLVAYCREQLPAHKVPVEVEFHDDLPKSGAGKLMKSALRQTHGAGTIR